MLVIGVAGGIASGKSSAAKCFERLGAVVLDADQIGHQVLCEPSVKQKIFKHWGDKVFKEEEVDRSALAEIVFESVVGFELDKLEQITHPIIGQRIADRLAQLESENVSAVVLDAPVMFKAGWDKFCDKIVFVNADLEVRRQRVAKRGWTASQLSRREEQQVEIETKCSRATDQIDNVLSEQEFFSEIEALWHSWRLPVSESKPT